VGNKETPIAKVAHSPRSGRVASEVTDPAEIQAIHAAYRGNGGTMSFKQIEADPKFNLRDANGNTAFRIIKRAVFPKKAEEPSAAAEASATAV